MAVKLEIEWDGDAPGLHENRLSLAAFGDSLKNLLVAFRRIASNQASQAVDEPNRGGKGGRLAKNSELIDLEIAQLRDGCITLEFECVTRGAEPNLFDYELYRAADEFLSSIEAESKGQFRSAVVRKYLKSLPAGLKKQRYTVLPTGFPERTVTVGDVDLAEDVEAMPQLQELIGNIVGVGFEPGKLEVRLLEAGGGRPLVCMATEQQVERAIGLRKGVIRALVVHGERPRLLWIRQAEAPARLVGGSPTSDLFDRWDGLLRRLAQ